MKKCKIFYCQNCKIIDYYLSGDKKNGKRLFNEHFNHGSITTLTVDLDKSWQNQTENIKIHAIFNNIPLNNKLIDDIRKYFDNKIKVKKKK